jgi:hypothetical protein
MPNIYDPGFDIPDIRPTEIGVEATAAAGRRLGTYGEQIAASKQQEGRIIGQTVKAVGDQAVQYEEHREINTGSRHAADMMATLNQSWNDYVTGRDIDPNDPQRQDKLEARLNNPQAAQQWREDKLEPALDQFKQGFLTQGGQDWAERFVDAYRDHATVKAASDISQMAGHVVQANVEKTFNSLSSTVFNDPSTLDFARDTLDHSIYGSVSTSHNLQPDKVAEVSSELKQKGEEQLVKAAVQGAIVRGGDWQKIANDPKNAPYINQAETLQFFRAEKFYQHADESEARSQRQDRDYQARNDFNGKVNALEADTMPQNVGDPPRLPSDYWQRARDLSAHPGAALEPGRMHAVMQNGDAITARLGKPEPLAGVSHATTMDLLTQMRATDDTRMADTGPIYKAYEDGKLNNQDFKFLQDQFSTMRTPEGERLDKDRDLFFKRYQLSIDPYAGADTDKTGRQPIYEAEMAARQREAAVRAAGGDPHSVYDPTSPNFFGKPENLRRFRDHEPLSSLFRQPGAPGGDLTAPLPDRPKNFPTNAQWDANARYWYVIQDGKKFRVDPTTAR